SWPSSRRSGYPPEHAAGEVPCESPPNGLRVCAQPGSRTSQRVSAGSAPSPARKDPGPPKQVEFEDNELYRVALRPPSTYSAFIGNLEMVLLPFTSVSTV